MEGWSSLKLSQLESLICEIFGEPLKSGSFSNSKHPSRSRRQRDSQLISFGSSLRFSQFERDNQPSCLRFPMERWSFFKLLQLERKMVLTFRTPLKSGSFFSLKQSLRSRRLRDSQFISVGSFFRLSQFERDRNSSRLRFPMDGWSFVKLLQPIRMISFTFGTLLKSEASSVLNTSGDQAP